MKKINLLPGFITLTLHLTLQNVGIGISTPAARLRIKGVTDITQLIIDANSKHKTEHQL